MAMPTWQGIGAVEGSTTTLTPTMPSGIVANDILLFICSCQGNGFTISLSPAEGFVQTASSPQDPAIGGSARLATYWKRAVGSDAAPVADASSTSHIIGVMCLIRGVKTTGDPWNISSGNTDNSSDTALSITGATTTAANCLVVAMSTSGRSTSNNLTSAANADLTSVTERIDTGVAVGVGGYIIAITGEKASAGAYGATTGSFGAVNNYEGNITLAFEGASVAATPGGMMLLRSG